jgi:DHA1 family tetracycline resistance protein-like MFS transporter
VAGALALANALYGFFVLPESLAPENRTPFSWRKANAWGSLRLLRSHPELFGLAMVNVLAQFAHYVLPAVFALYALERYGWTSSNIGWVLAGIGLCAAVVQGLITGRVVKRFGERATLLCALLFGAAGFAVYGLAPNGAVFWMGVPIMSLWGMAGPASQSLMTRYVGTGEQGQLQGANMSLGSLAGVVAPVVFGATFSFFAEHPELPAPGAPSCWRPCCWSGRRDWRGAPAFGSRNGTRRRRSRPPSPTRALEPRSREPKPRSRFSPKDRLSGCDF